MKADQTPVAVAALSEEIVRLCAEDFPGSISETFGEFLQHIPRRWGRMDLVTRVAVAVTGKLLSDAGGLADKNVTGLVTGSRYGSVVTDLEFARTAREGTPAPLLFSYTLPNIAASEAAAHFGLTGPVYAVLDPHDPEAAAHEEALRLMRHSPHIQSMIAGIVDVDPSRSVSAMLALFCRSKGKFPGRPR